MDSSNPSQKRGESCSGIAAKPSGTSGRFIAAAAKEDSARLCIEHVRRTELDLLPAPFAVEVRIELTLIAHDAVDA